MDFSLFWPIGFILFLSTVVVRVAGFGGSLTAVPLLAPLIGVPVATPIMSLFGVTNFSVVIFQQWRDITFRDVWRMVVTTILFTPLGIYLVFIIPESTLRLTLGIVCIAYSIYRLLKLPSPKLKNVNWGWFVGIIAGLASGAFAVGGVPAVIYADMQEWQPEQFRLNMFSFFLVTSCFSVMTRFAAGQITWQVIGYWLGAIPFMMAGLFVGKQLALRVNKERFRQLVLVMLIVLGVRLIRSAFA